MYTAIYLSHLDSFGIIWFDPPTCYFVLLLLRLSSHLDIISVILSHLASHLMMSAADPTRCLTAGSTNTPPYLVSALPEEHRLVSLTATTQV